MFQGIYTITENKPIVASIFKIQLQGDTKAITAPGQFVNIKLDGFYLRRPISVFDYDNTSITLIYKVVGKGTAYMAQLAPGQKLDLLVGLGNGFDTSKSGENPVVIGGGVGVPPMYALAKQLIAEGKSVTAILG